MGVASPVDLRAIGWSVVFHETPEPTVCCPEHYGDDVDRGASPRVRIVTAALEAVRIQRAIHCPDDKPGSRKEDHLRAGCCKK